MVYGVYNTYYTVHTLGFFFLLIAAGVHGHEYKILENSNHHFFLAFKFSSSQTYLHAIKQLFLAMSCLELK